MQLEIRKANKKDIVLIRNILNHEIENSTAVYDKTPKSLQEITVWLEQKQKTGFPVIVAVSENEILGYGSYGKFRPWEGFRYSVEHSIYVAFQHRGKGIGKKLLQELIKLAKNENYHSMIAGIDAANNKSIHFHEQFGFKKVGHIPEAGFKFGRWLDLVFMQLMLEEK
ncbi:MAG: N-acetyltransferase family protein [Chitinophagales bacterium]